MLFSYYQLGLCTLFGNFLGVLIKKNKKKLGMMGLISEHSVWRSLGGGVFVFLLTAIAHFDHHRQYMT